MPRIVTVLELATVLKLSRHTIYRRVEAGVIVPLKNGAGRGKLRFDLDKVLRDLRDDEDGEGVRL